MIIQKKLELHTKGFNHIIDITPTLQNYISDEKISDGYVLVFVPGATGGLTTIEYEPGLLEDFPDMLDKIAPMNKSYLHDKTWHDGNGHSHLQATTVGPSVTVPVTRGALVLGTWQQIFHLECDIKPRQREIVVTVVGE